MTRITFLRYVRQLYVFIMFILWLVSSGHDALANGPEHQRYVLTISGGVSLGAYEGGQLYFLMNHLRARTPPAELAVVTGASAGSLNGLIAIMSSCGLRQEAPLDSLAYRVWHSVDLAGLARPSEVTPISVFSRKAFGPAIAAIKQAWMEGVDEKCDILFGVSVTRRTPIQQQVRPGLVVIRQAENFVFRIQGRGKQKPPQISNALLGDGVDPQLFLPFTGNDDTDFDLLMRTLQASGSFPLAFEPMLLRYCSLSPGLAVTCDDSNAVASEFIDGGVFDNTPLRLAERIARHRYPNDGDYKKLLFGVISAGGETHPAAATATDNQSSPDKAPGLFSFLNELSRNLVTTTRGREITTLLTERPHFQEKLLINVSVFPPAGNYYYAFSGFIDSGFREFDFALGMWEAKYFVTHAAHEQIDKVGTQRAGSLLPIWGRDFDSPPWEIYRCIDQAAQAEKPASEVCQLNHAQSRRLLPIIDTTFDLVSARCRSGRVQTSAFPSCNMLAKKKVELVPEPQESDRDYFFRALEERHYVYDNPKKLEGKQWMRELMQPVMQGWARKQPVHERVFVTSGSEIMLDRLSYAPPKEISYLLVGPAIAMGKSYSLADSPDSALSMGRWEFGSMIQGLGTYLGRSRDMLALTPYIGMMVDLTPFIHVALRPRIGLRAGYQTSSGDSWGKVRCSREDNQQISYACSQATLHPYLSMSLLDRLRFDVVYQIFPWQRTSQPGELSLMIGLQDLMY